jgi:hypothetical protein
VKRSSLFSSTTAVILFSAAALSFAVSAPAAQDPAAPQAAPNPPAPATAPQQGAQPGSRPMRNFPPPTNLKVLPKDMSGRDVRDLMQKWAGSLGVHCDTCHMADPNNPGPNGRPRLNYADDSKPDKQIARIMYTMTGQMNKDYISKAMDLDKDEMGSPVTCGTCHRGHKMPEEFVIPPEGPRGGPAGAPGGPGPAAPPPPPPPTN